MIKKKKSSKNNKWYDCIMSGDLKGFLSSFVTKSNYEWKG